MTFCLLLRWRIELPDFWKNNVQVANNTYSLAWVGVLEIRDINNQLSKFIVQVDYVQCILGNSAGLFAPFIFIVIVIGMFI